MASPSLTLNNGKNMPMFGLGTWLADPGVVGESVKNALENGYKHIDCASCYMNEPEIGVVFANYFKTNPREDIFITSKLWCKDFTKVNEACKKTLKDLQLEYLDLYLIHLPFELEATLKSGIPLETGVGLIGYAAQRIQEVWKEMEKLVDEGLVKSIGISNFTIKKTEELLNSSPRIVPACNQVELHPFLPQNRLIDYSKSKGITLVAYTPLGNPGRPWKSSTEPSLLNNPVIKTVADKHKVTAGQVLMAWGLDRGYGVLVKTVNKGRLSENLASRDVKLDAEDMAVINAIENRFRYVPQEWALKVGEEIEALWDGEYL